MVYKFTVTTSHDASEVVADAMFDVGGMGVCINDPKNFDEIDKFGSLWDYIDDSDKEGVVTAEGFFDCENPETVLAELSERLKLIKDNFPLDVGSLNASYDVVPEVNWLEEWKKFYKPIVLDKISIIPAWFEPVGEKYIFIEPGQAFGTGEHESTKICLELLEQVDLDGKDIVDVGCGSGIIGMAGLKLGAKSCYFSDLDAKALENLKVNLELNNFTDNIEIKHASLLEGFERKVDVIFANITADILMLLAPQIESHLKDDGQIVISGIIAPMVDEVINKFNSCGYKAIKSFSQKDWRGFVLVRDNGN